MSKNEMASVTSDNFFRLFDKAVRPPDSGPPHEFAPDDPRLRVVGRRAAHRRALGRLRSGQPEEPAPALLGAGRAPGRGGTTRVLIDTSPDLRQQLLDTGVGELEGVLYTHDHADHTNGIDELRSIALNMRQRVPVWADQRTGETLQSRFSYCFYRAPGSDYPPILELNRLVPARTVEIDGPGGASRRAAVRAAPRPDRRAGLPHRRRGLYAGPQRDSRREPGGAGRSRRVDRRCAAATPHPSHFTLDESLGWIDGWRRSAPC
jgi:phosphoribosyl 1,2-cyclic phosphodiesterase